MSSSQVEALRPLFQGDVAATPDLSLVERVEDLDRAVAMKAVLGPHLDAMLRPIYEPEINEEESLPSMEGDFPMRVLDHFFERLRSTLYARFHASVSGGEEYKQFLDLNRNRKDLFFYADNPIQNIREAIGTSIGVPLTVASWISGLERPKEPAGYPLRDVDGLTEIMERRSFSSILLRLTKGPNEFLGKDSDKLMEADLSRFYAIGTDENRLWIRNAFAMQNGKVVGLSEAYAIAAERRRQELRSRPPTVHQGNDSSGCPVRHGFEDVSGSRQQPLILTATKFLASALRHAEQIPFKATT